MHDRCITCKEKEREQVESEELDEYERKNELAKLKPHKYVGKTLTAHIGPLVKLFN